MKPLIMVILLIALLVIGWICANLWPQQITDALTTLGFEKTQSAKLIAALQLGLSQPLESEKETTTLIASGTIEAEEVRIVSEVQGRAQVLAEEGDELKAGDIVIQLDTELLQARIGEAQAGVEAAKANLAQILAPARPEIVAAAEAAVAQAVVIQEGARTAWENALALRQNPQELEARLIKARTQVEIAAHQIEQARAQLAAAEVQRDRFKGAGSAADKAQYEAYSHQVAAAEEAVRAAEAAKAAAEQLVADLEAMRANPLSLEAQVHNAEAQFRVATAGVAAAEAARDKLLARATPAEIALARAQVQQAEAALNILLVQLEKYTMRSPCDGVVTNVTIHQGEVAQPGTVLMTVANLDRVTLRVYIPEDEIGRIRVGQMVSVTTDSFPGRVFQGELSYIAAQAEFTPKNIQTEKERVNMVFAVKVRIPNPDHALKPGMPADAEFHIQ